jgi:hypothetical protein
VILRHPVDGSQWRKIERDYPDFAGDARNLRAPGLQLYVSITFLLGCA